MRRSFLNMALVLAIAAGCSKQEAPKSEPTPPKPRTISSFDLPQPGEAAKFTVNFDKAELSQVMKLYAEISGRSVIWATNLPDARITFTSAKGMTAPEALQAMDTMLAAQEMTTVFTGTEYVKIIPTKNAPSETPPIVELKFDQLPDSSSFLMYVVRPKNKRPSDAAKALMSFARMPNSILAIDAQPTRPPSTLKQNFPFIPDSVLDRKDGVLILRDYSSNVKRMLQVLEQIDQP